MNNFSVDYAGSYINWANTSSFIIPGTLSTLILPAKNNNSSRQLFFSDVVLVSNYYCCKEEAIKLISYYMIDISYKTVKQSHLKKLQIIQNINNLMSQVIFMFSDWILIKQIIVSSTFFCCWGKRILGKMPSRRMSNFFLRTVWWQELQDKFWVERDTP